MAPKLSEASQSKVEQLFQSYELFTQLLTQHPLTENVEPNIKKGEADFRKKFTLHA